MKRAAVLVALLALTITGLTPSGATADTSAKFDYHIADSFISAGVGITQTGARAEADNKDAVTVQGSGTFNVGSNDATGGGTFEHRDKKGNLLGSGSWTATSVQSFESFGCGGGFPPNFCGGVLVLNVHLVGTPAGSTTTVELDGVLTVTCTIGTVPPGAVEGITLNIPGFINFDKTIFELTGLTLYVSRSKNP